MTINHRERRRRRRLHDEVRRSQAPSEPRAGSPESIELGIEELGLTGFQPGDRYRIGDSLETELGRLFESQDGESIVTDARFDRLDAGSFPVDSGARPELTGAHIARAIHRSLSDHAARAFPSSVPEWQGLRDQSFSAAAPARSESRFTDVATATSDVGAGTIGAAVEPPRPSQSRGSAIPTGKVAMRQSDDHIPPIERHFELPPHVVRMEASAVPECDRGQTYDPRMRRCRPPMCQDLSLDQARQFVEQKLTETSRWVPPFAAAIRRGRFARFFPALLEQELTKAALAVVDQLRTGTIKIECSGEVSGAQSPNERLVRLPSFAAAGSPPWTQLLMNRVVLHECLHIVCSNLPSQPGKDPYENAAKLGFDPGSAMHGDLGPIMTPFPHHIPKW